MTPSNNNDRGKRVESLQISKSLSVEVVYSKSANCCVPLWEGGYAATDPRSVHTVDGVNERLSWVDWLMSVDGFSREKWLGQTVDPNG